MSDYSVYILECSDKSFYCGITTDIDRRLKMHNKGKASKCTRSRLPVKLIYIENGYSKSSALKREYEIKQLTRAQKEKLVEKYR